ncbi:MAG: pentapeptide repeat-containing protein [Rhodospirillales bacterium]|nr:pentapeptide repeat-containing protein [Rhodospirillales bacterium]
MAEKEQILEFLYGEEALALARKGQDAWNEWARNNPKTKVDFSDIAFTVDSISFEGFVFPGPVSFRNVVLKNVNFSGAAFSGGDADFTSAQFTVGDVDFTGAKFSGGVANFTVAKFSGGNAYFTGVEFSGGDAYFIEAAFSGGHANFFDAKFNGGNADFSEAVFSGGNADFNEAKFIGVDAIFTIATFSRGLVNFYDAKFCGGDAVFSGAAFIGGSAHFEKAKFIGGCADFSGAKFDFPVYLQGARFTQVPDFRHTTLAAHFTLHDVRVSFWDDAERNSYFLKQAKKPDDADKLRRLKELASNAKDHEREQDFFASELRAKRFHEAMGASLIWSYLYEWCSDFGRSTFRPILLLFSIWGVFGWGYWLLADGPCKSFADGLRFSFATMPPFVAASRTALSEARENLYGTEVGVLVDALAFIEGYIGLAPIFLIGLALRNRFRI